MTEKPHTRDIAVAAVTQNLMRYIFTEHLQWVSDYKIATLNGAPLLSKSRWFSVKELIDKIIELGGKTTWWREVRKEIQEELATNDKWKTDSKQSVWFSGPWHRGYKITHDPKEAYRMVAFLARIAEGFGISIATQIDHAKDYAEIPQLMATLDEEEIGVDDLTQPIAEIPEDTLKLLQPPK